MAGEYNPFQSMLNPNMRQTSLWDLRMMSAANRSETPFERGMRGPGRTGISGNPVLANLAAGANEPDYSSFTYDPQMQAQAIAAGVQPLEASQVRQNALLPNTGFFGNHPRLARALEGAMFAGAATPGGGGIQSTGTGIANVLEGVIGGHAIQQGAYRQQFARPFEAAGMLEQLRDVQEQRELRGAQIKHYQDESDIQNARVAAQHANEIARINATRPVPVEGGTYLYNPASNPTTPGGNYVQPGPEGQPSWTFQAGPGKSSPAARNLTPATREKLMGMGVDPANATSDQIAEASQAVLHDKVSVVGAGAGAREHAEQPYKNLAEAQKAHDSTIKGYQAKLLKQDDPGHRTTAQQEITMQHLMDRNYHGSLIPSKAEIDTYIQQNNAAIQQQIDQENESFKQQYPQTQTLPPEGKKNNSSPKRGSQQPTTGFVRNADGSYTQK